MSEDNLSSFKSVADLSEQYLEQNPGVYLFYYSIDGPIRYVGRSHDLFSGVTPFRKNSPVSIDSVKRPSTPNEQLSELNYGSQGHKYIYYRYQHSESELEAFKLQCYYYHKCWQTQESQFHPSSLCFTEQSDENRRGYCQICGYPNDNQNLENIRNSNRS